ncbi:MAG: hypothetical protein ACPGVN_05085 [Alphaproteobacteria bacterium]
MRKIAIGLLSLTLVGCGASHHSGIGHYSGYSSCGQRSVCGYSSANTAQSVHAAAGTVSHVTKHVVSGAAQVVHGGAHILHGASMGAMHAVKH